MNYQIVGGYSNYFPGDQYSNNIALSTIEFLSYIVAGILYHKFKVKKVLIGSFLFSMVGSLGICFSDKTEHPIWDLLFTLTAKAGISACYELVYMANDLFPLIFSSTSFGVCNMFAGIAQVVAV